ncbi:MAG: D-alanyl-D-alanine carboxypeptidase/D-alanyl-D-alanine-endopeptidase [Anaerolineaceae bacterium]|nr:D-alanyl-D-alanine carboxypeptidase/D-alanyl-D-alanine-endopeptidase [Anaerolineaceae bacterium]
MTARRRLCLIIAALWAMIAFQTTFCPPARADGAAEKNEAGPAKAPVAQALARLLKGLTDDPQFAKVRLAVQVVEAASGRTIFAANETAAMVPASTMKLATTAAALEVLGADFKFRTIIGTLGDDLAILGGGDPNLSGRFYGGDITAAPKRWAALLKSRGVKAIKGDLVFDDSVFESQWVHPGWPVNQYNEWYEAPVGGLVLNDSCVEVHVRPAARTGLPALVTISPPTRYFKLRGRILTRSKSRNNLRIDRPRGSETFVLKGTVPLKSGRQTYLRTVHDPGAFAATVIRETFAAEGLPIAGRVVRKRLWTRSWQLPKGFQAQVVHTSTLAQTVAVANTRSQNLYAECILKALAAYSGNKDRPWPSAQGAWTAGRQEVARTLDAMGVPTGGCVFDDGCGLSRRNRLTPRALTKLLLVMYRGKQAEMWMNSLATSGDPGGSLRNRMGDEPLRGRVHAKTGYLRNVRALAGYVRTLSGRTIAFAMLADRLPYNSYHHSAVKKWMDDTCRVLVKM